MGQHSEQVSPNKGKAVLASRVLRGYSAQRMESGKGLAAKQPRVDINNMRKLSVKS